MQSKITRLEYLRQTVLALDDDLLAPWTDYDCMEWPFLRNHNGYGFIRQGKSGGVFCHRESYEAVFGPVINSHVLHRCDNPPCFRPVHLFPGSDKDNVDDMITKGRQNHSGLRPWMRGIGVNPKQKLTDQQVALIRQLKTDGRLQKFGVSAFQISQIVRNRSRKI